MTSELNNIERISETLDAEYHAMHHIISDSNWDARAVMNQVAKDVSQSLPKQTLTGLLIDESGWVKRVTKALGLGINTVEMWAKRPIRRLLFLAACEMANMPRW